MEFVIAGVVIVAVLGILWYRRDVVLNELEESAEEFSHSLEEVVQELREEVEDLEEKLPTKNQLMKMKKDAIEEVGRKFGIELDKRKTKEKMVNELHKEVKGK